MLVASSPCSSLEPGGLSRWPGHTGMLRPEGRQPTRREHRSPDPLVRFVSLPERKGIQGPNQTHCPKSWNTQPLALEAVPRCRHPCLVDISQQRLKGSFEASGPQQAAASRAKGPRRAGGRAGAAGRPPGGCRGLPAISTGTHRCSRRPSRRCPGSPQRTGVHRLPSPGGTGGDSVWDCASSCAAVEPVLPATRGQRTV